MNLFLPWLLIFLCAHSGAIFFSSGVLEKNIVPDQIHTSTNAKQALLAIDGKHSTYWESVAQLPHGYIHSPINNVLLKHDSGNNPDLEMVFDGDLNSSIKLNQIEFFIPKTQQDSTTLSIKCGVNSGNVLVQIYRLSKWTTIENITTQTNYNIIKIGVSDAKSIDKIRLVSQDSFELFEVAIPKSIIEERIKLAIEKPQPIKYIQLYGLWMEACQRIKLYQLDQHGTKKSLIAEINKKALQKHSYLDLGQERILDKILIVFELEHKNWSKLRIDEIVLFDKNFTYGAKPKAQPSILNLKELLGVNVYWGLGFNKYSKFIEKGKGIEKLASVASHLRSYHNMTWDIPTPQTSINFDKMSESGTPANTWLNWDIEYGYWNQTGLEICTSLQIHDWKDTDWLDIENTAYQYGYSYAKHFGSNYGNGLVQEVEIGNEPWKYEPSVYKKILAGMARGIKEADPNMKVFPCALQAFSAERDQTDQFKNYIDSHISPSTYKYLDGINVHCYSYDQHNVFKQKSLHPESSKSVFWEIIKAIEWRDKNMPQKEIILSEWGWDCGHIAENCTHRQCIDESLAAAYAVRGALIAHRLGIHRADWFYHANEPGESGLYKRSGFFTSTDTNSQSKLPYHSMKWLVTILGDANFQSISSEQNAWIYDYVNTENGNRYKVAWLPIDNLLDSLKVSFLLESIPKKVYNFPAQEEAEYHYDIEDEKLYINLSGMPTIIEY